VVQLSGITLSLNSLPTEKIDSIALTLEEGRAIGRKDYGKEGRKEGRKEGL
jgi:hypothetical protein